jgi:hypothetical protein
VLVCVSFASLDAGHPLNSANPKTRRIALDGRWEARGNFRTVRVDEAYVQADERRLLYWLAVPAVGSEGFVATPPFKAPQILAFLVTGDIDGSENAVWVESVADGRRLPVRTNSGYFWRRVAWILPQSWRGQLIRVVATNRQSGQGCRLGVSSPYALDEEGVRSAHWNKLRIVPLTFLAMVLFLSMGLLFALMLAGRLRLPSSLLVITGVAISSLVGYAVFWAYFISAPLGHAVGTGASLVGAASLAVVLVASPTARRLVRSPDVLAPLGFWLATVLLYQSVVLAVDLGLPDSEMSAYRFTDFPLDVDSQLPLLLADKLYDGADPRRFFADWHSSDRPPLQSGLVLEQMAVASTVGQPLPLYYQLLGCVLQCTWVPALWAVSRSISPSLGKAAAVMVCVIFTGFTLVNSTYVWPKLLAAALVLFAFVLILRAAIDGRRLTWTEAAGVGIGVALGTLAHGSSAFACLALGMFALCFLSTLGWRGLGASLIVAVGLSLPWLAYQRVYDPPGNRLVKWHLAGAVAVDDRSFLQALADGYAAAGVRGAVGNKISNLKTLVAENDEVLFGNYPEWREGTEPALSSWRRKEFHQLAFALGVLNLAWIVPIAASIGWRRLEKAEGLILLFVLAGLAAWVVLMFGPATTVIHQGPYATFLLIFALLAYWIVSLPLPWAILLVALHVGWFLVVWVFTSPANGYALPNDVLIVLSILIAASIGALARRLARISAGTTSAAPLPAMGSMEDHKEDQN